VYKSKLRAREERNRVSLRESVEIKRRVLKNISPTKRFLRNVSNDLLSYTASNYRRQ
jgi:hypothetical protein